MNYLSRLLHLYEFIYRIIFLCYIIHFSGNVFFSDEELNEFIVIASFIIVHLLHSVFCVLQRKKHVWSNLSPAH